MPAKDALGLVRASLLDRGGDCVEHERDPGHRLDRPVVQEQGEPAALVLLGRDQLVREPRMLGREALDLLFHSLVVLALADDSDEPGPRGRDREEQPDEREQLRVQGQPEHGDDRADADDDDEQEPGASR